MLRSMYKVAFQLVAFSWIFTLPSLIVAADSIEIEAVGFNGIKQGSRNVLYRPWLGKRETASSEPSAIPGYPTLAVGNEIWTFPLYGKKSFQNKISKIEIIKGLYGYDGGDIALEITLQKNIDNLDNNNLDNKVVLMNKPLPSQSWKIENILSDILAQLDLDAYSKKGYETKKITTLDRNFVLLSLPEDKVIENKDWRTTHPPVHILFHKVGSSWTKVYEDRNWQIQEIADLDGDGFPEFYKPYTDSSDGNLVAIYPKENRLDIDFSSGH